MIRFLTDGVAEACPAKDLHLWSWSSTVTAGRAAHAARKLAVRSHSGNLLETSITEYVRPARPIMDRRGRASVRVLASSGPDDGARPGPVLRSARSIAMSVGGRPGRPWHGTGGPQRARRRRGARAIRDQLRRSPAGPTLRHRLLSRASPHSRHRAAVCSRPATHRCPVAGRWVSRRPGHRPAGRPRRRAGAGPLERTPTGLRGRSSTGVGSARARRPNSRQRRRRRRCRRRLSRSPRHRYRGPAPCPHPRRSVGPRRTSDRCGAGPSGAVSGAS